MVIAPAKPLTLEAFLELPETKPASEYINGEIIQKPMPQGEHSTLQGDLNMIQLSAPSIIYPESDGKPLADNTIQFRLIMTIHGGITTLLADQPNVFVAGDLLWYPVEENPRINQAPDVMVAFGRPKGDRRSYIQHQENGIAPQVVFEIVSHTNTRAEMGKKLDFYDQYGVEEYYVYDPQRIRLQGYLRDKNSNSLGPISQMQGWVSPRLRIRFTIEEEELQIYRPDGQRFLTYEEVVDQWQQTQEWAEQERQRAEQERQRAEQAESELAELRRKLANLQQGLDQT
jgi:Uma2 family endonuclease